MVTVAVFEFGIALKEGVSERTGLQRWHIRDLPGMRISGFIGQLRYHNWVPTFDIS